MGGSRRHQDDRLARLHSADPVDDQAIGKGPARPRLCLDFGEQALGHARIVLKSEGGKRRPFARDPDTPREGRNRADMIMTSGKGIDFRCGVERFCLDANHIVQPPVIGGNSAISRASRTG